METVSKNYSSSADIEVSDEFDFIRWDIWIKNSSNPYTYNMFKYEDEWYEVSVKRDGSNPQVLLASGRLYWLAPTVSDGGQWYKCDQLSSVKDLIKDYTNRG